MSIKVDNIKCPQNHTCPCIELCPVGAINQSGYAAPTVDEQKCIRCLKCVNHCPKKALTIWK